MATAADVVTNNGRAWIAGLLSNQQAPVANYYVAWATGPSTAAVTDVALDTEVDSRVAATMSRVTTTVTNDTSQAVALLTAGTARNIQAAGVWTASTAGTLIQESSHATVPLLTNDSIQYTFKNKIA